MAPHCAGYTPQLYAPTADGRGVVRTTTNASFDASCSPVQQHSVKQSPPIGQHDARRGERAQLSSGEPHAQRSHATQPLPHDHRIMQGSQQNQLFSVMRQASDRMPGAVIEPSSRRSSALSSMGHFVLQSGTRTRDGSTSVAVSAVGVSMYRCESHTHTVGHGYFRLGCRLSAMDISLSRAPFRSKSKTAHTWARSDICDSVMTCGPVENHTAHRRASRSYPHVRVITVAQAHLLGAYTLIMLLTTTHADPHGSLTRASYILMRVCHRSPPHTTRGGPRTSCHLCLSMGCWGVRRHELCTPHTRISVHGTTTFRVLTRAAYIRVG